MAEADRDAILGAGAHKRTHAVAVVDGTGRGLAVRRFEANASGYAQALRRSRAFGSVVRAGAEPTGAYGRGLRACLAKSGIGVLDVYAPDGKRRRLGGEDDAKDARQAAQAALSRTRCAKAKEDDGALEAALALENAHRLAARWRTAAMNALEANVVELEDSARRRLEALSNADLARTCAAFRLPAAGADLSSGAKPALKRYAKQIQSFNKSIEELDGQLERYAHALALRTIQLAGIGRHGAVALLGAAGANIDRLEGEGSFSMLCGTSPVPASRGDAYRRRLDKGGNRRANGAIHIMAIARMRRCERTRAFVAKKMSEGKSRKDAFRALKRYLSREVHGALRADLGAV